MEMGKDPIMQILQAIAEDSRAFGLILMGVRDEERGKTFSDTGASVARERWVWASVEWTLLTHKERFESCCFGPGEYLLIGEAATE